MKYVIATANPGKISEMREILFDIGIDIVTRDDLGINIVVEETGTTFSENAQLKANAICAMSAMPAIADDSGLIVDALGGEPGVYSSSFGGEALTSAERCMYLLKKMENTEQRDAKFVCTITCAFPNGDILSANGECSGTIATRPYGSSGFGYDPVFIPEGESRTMAQLTSAEKNAISHRGKALVKFAGLLKKYNEGIRV